MSSCEGNYDCQELALDLLGMHRRHSGINYAQYNDTDTSIFKAKLGSQSNEQRK